MLSNLCVPASLRATVRQSEAYRLRIVAVPFCGSRCPAFEPHRDRYGHHVKRTARPVGVQHAAAKPRRKSSVTAAAAGCTDAPAGRESNEVREGLSPPEIYAWYRRTEEKAGRHPASLTSDELRLLVRGLPRHYRHKHVPSYLVEEAFDGGMLTFHELARTNCIDLNHAIRFIGEKGQLLKALRLTNYLVQTGKANQHTLAAFFGTCAHVNRPMVVPRVWEMWMRDDLMGEISAGSAVYCVARYDPDAALDMLERMQQLGVSLLKDSYHQVLKGLSQNGNLQSAMQLFESMKELEAPLAPCVITLQHVLTLVHQCQAWEHTDDIYRYMLRSDVVPDSQLSSTLMKVFCAGRQLQRAEIIFRSNLQQWGVTPDRYHFNTLLAAHAQLGDLQAVKRLVRDMEARQVVMDEHSVVFMLTAAARSSGTDLADVNGVLELAHRHGLRRNTWVCAALIQAYRNCVKVAPPRRQELGEAVFRDMEARGLQMNGVVLNSLLALFWETFEYRKARVLYDQMLEMGVMPNDRTCQIMVQMCEEAGWLEQATGFQQLRRTMRKIEGTKTLPWNRSGTEVLDLGSAGEGEEP